MPLDFDRFAANLLALSSRRALRNDEHEIQLTAMSKQLHRLKNQQCFILYGQKDRNQDAIQTVT